MRIAFIDYDARRRPRTDRFCVACQRDLKAGVRVRTVHVVADENGSTPFALHPEDEAAWAAQNTDTERDHGIWLIGNDCAKILGLEWTKPE